MPAITFSGLASGIDADKIISTLSEQKRLVSAPIKSKITENENENKALEEFNTKILGLGDILKDFLTTTGNAVAKKAISSNELAVTASVGSGAIAGTTSINVLSLAKSSTISFNDTFSSLTDSIAPSLAGTSNIEIKLGSGSSEESFNIEINNQTTLSDLVNSINSINGGGKVSASVINVGLQNSPQYKLVISSVKTGIENGALEVNVSQEIQDQGILVGFNSSQAEDAQIFISGVGNINRPTNQISDIIPGVTLDLKQAGLGNTSISIVNDVDKTTKKLADFVVAFNELILFSKDNSKIERVEDGNKVSNKYGSLSKTTVDNQAVDAIKAALSRSNSGLDNSEIRIFADLGITTERNGTLKFDSAKFTSAVSKDSNAVNGILNSFADQTASTSGIIFQYTKFQGIIEQSKSSNDEDITQLNDRIARLEESIKKQEENLRRMFTNLETTTARLNQNSSALLSLFNQGKS